MKNAKSNEKLCNWHMVDGAPEFDVIHALVYEGCSN
jgi:hypothetical protein